MSSMQNRNPSFIQQLDALVIFTLVCTGATLFILNGFADLFLELGIRQVWLQRTIIVAPFIVAAVLLALLVSRRQPDSLELTQHSLEERVQQQRKARTHLIYGALLLMALLAFHLAILAGWLDGYVKINNPYFGLILAIAVFTPQLISEMMHFIRLRKIIEVLRRAQ